MGFSQTRRTMLVGLVGLLALGTKDFEDSPPISSDEPLLGPTSIVAIGGREGISGTYEFAGHEYKFWLGPSARGVQVMYTAPKLGSWFRDGTAQYPNTTVPAVYKLTREDHLRRITQLVESQPRT